MQSPYPCLWFKSEAAEAAAFYCSVFPNSEIKQQNETVTFFTLNGSPYMALNGGVDRPFTDAVSLAIACDTQEEIDHYWSALTKDGGSEVECGWLTDKYGLRWQVFPAKLGEWLTESGKGKELMEEVVLRSKKLHIADFEAVLNR